MNHLWSTQKEHLCTLTRHMSCCYISLSFLFWSEGYTNFCTAFCSWVSKCRRKTLLSHWGSASDSDSSPKHFLRTSHSLHLSKQLERTAARVTGGRVRHRDCITPCWLLHTGRVCESVYWNWQLQCAGASLRAEWSMARWVITHGPQRHTGIINSVNNAEHIRGLELSGRLTSCDCSHGGLIHVCRFSRVVMWGVRGVRKLQMGPNRPVTPNPSSTAPSSPENLSFPGL